jgi:hypothetical protein
MIHGQMTALYKNSRKGLVFPNLTVWGRCGNVFGLPGLIKADR